MPDVQSTTPDIFIKSGQANFEIVDIRTDLPSFADTGSAKLILRIKGGTSVTEITGGTIGGSAITIEANTVGLAAGLYDGEWDILGATAEIMRLPAGKSLLVEVVEPLS